MTKLDLESNFRETINTGCPNKYWLRVLMSSGKLGELTKPNFHELRNTACTPCKILSIKLCAYFSELISDPIHIDSRRISYHLIRHWKKSNSIRSLARSQSQSLLHPSFLSNNKVSLLVGILGVSSSSSSSFSD